MPAAPTGDSERAGEPQAASDGVRSTLATKGGTLPSASNAIVRDNLEFHLERQLPVALGSGPVEERAAATLRVCESLRRLGICALLGKGDTAKFTAGLHASAQAYLALLRSVRWSEVTDRYHLCASRAQPFFDAVAIEDWKTARAIAAATAQDRSEPDEYADEFAYARLMMAMVGEPGGEAEERKWLRAFQTEAASSDDDTRWDVVKALSDRSDPQFEKALKRYLDRREFEIEERLKQVGVEGEWRATERHVSIEGVAFLPARLAAGDLPSLLHARNSAARLREHRKEVSSRRRVETLGDAMSDGHVSDQGADVGVYHRVRGYRDNGHTHIAGSGRATTYADTARIQGVLRKRGTKPRRAGVAPASPAHAQAYTFAGNPDNFIKGHVPYHNQGHHLLPCEAFGSMTADQRRLLKKVAYDINAGPNIIFLPSCARDGEFHNLPYHQGSHPKYNTLVKNDLKKVRQSLDREITRDPKHENWKPPEEIPQLLRELELDYWGHLTNGKLASRPINTLRVDPGDIHPTSPERALMEFQVWKDDDDDEKLAWLDDSADEAFGNRGFMLSDGVSVASWFPSKLVFPLSKENGTRLADNIPNTCLLSVVSERLREVLAKNAPTTNFEFLPVLLKPTGKAVLVVQVLRHEHRRHASGDERGEVRLQNEPDFKGSRFQISPAGARRCSHP